MRKALIVLAFIFTLLSVIFAILPMGTLGLLPVGLALVFSGLAYAKSAANDRTVPKWLLIVAGLILVVVIAKSMTPDEVEKDVQMEQQKIESQKEDLKDLEELEAIE
ncbi:hypothetical protein G4D82_00945 [Flavobacterium sp. CYK-4]|uniref:hypothetical protein n=1 Tax=Flavobacterium lotistagni TaxID=2709660 RepID=UPI00140E54D7|nr:hypothetical protein [Flavobacterium lotistagni]NHM05774.1 hypothetical protein [Flavobacterium lotistagni]